MKKRKPSKIIRQLMEGYKKFHLHYFKKNNALYQKLVKGQAPKTMVIACSDSRVDPALILNCSPGELFVVRNVANLVPPCEDDAKHHGTSAALEFAVCFLEVEHIIILGHTHCGGIQALLYHPTKTSKTRGFVSSWMEIAKDAKEIAIREHQSPKEQEKHCCEYSLMASMDNLYTFPWIKNRVEEGHLSLHAWLFDLESGAIRKLNPKTETFEEVPV